jgi:type IV pilus assembly protein PilQ
MMYVIALLLATLAPAASSAVARFGPHALDSQIATLSVAPSDGRTEIVIRVDGTVTAGDFMMDDGRLVVDLTGATHSGIMDREIDRGGIRRLRIAQYQPHIVRLVFVLDARRDYQLTRETDGVRIMLANPDGEFEPWNASFRRPDAAPVVEEPAPAPAPRRAQSLPQQPQQRRHPPITVSFDNQPVKDVIAMFAAAVDTTILLGPDLATKAITATVTNLPWDVALRTILEANGMELRTLAGGVLVVEDAAKVAERVQAEPPVTQQFPIQYVSADSIQTAVLGVLGETGTVGVNRSSNALIVTGTLEAIERVRSILPQLDVLAPQVDIEAKIAFVDRTTLEALGVSYDLKDSQGTQLTGLAGNYLDANGNGIFEPDEATEESVIMLGGNSIAAIGNAQARVSNPALRLAMTLLLGRHSLITFLEALQTVSMTDIQAKPMIRTMDHRRAEILVGENTPIRVIDAGAQTGGLQAPRANVQFRETGVILDVTPHITGDQVVLDIRAERSNIGAAPADLGYTFQTQRASTQVIVEDGQTIVIGGLTVTEKTSTRSGIPVLMDIPVIGALFRSDTDRENKRDLLIMVTPHIVRER